MSRISAPALRRGLDILELFLDANDGLRVPDITAKLDLPRASAHELVATLVDRGYLQAVSEPPSRYKLGINAFRLGAAYEREIDMLAIGREHAAAVAAKCGETVQIVIREGAYVVYIVRIDSTHTVRLVSNVGTRLPAWCTAGGKAMLAALSDAALDELFPTDADLVPMTDNSISTRERLFTELAEIRTRGWSEENSESNTNVACVAAPIRDRSGATVAAMSISVPLMRWNKQVKARYTKLVLEGAAEMSASLGS